jgi:hypothetical protein
MDVLTLHGFTGAVASIASVFTAFAQIFKRARAFSLANPGHFVFLVTLLLVFLGFLVVVVVMHA